MFIAGIDENGLGPKLGPLVVTGALFEAEGGRYDPGAFRRALEIPPGSGAAPVADSKTVMGSSAMARGETTVLAVLALLSGGVPDSADALLEGFCDPPLSDMREACPAAARALCLGADLRLPAFGGDASAAGALGEALRARLAAEGLRLAAASSEALCPRRFNEAVSAPGANKAGLDLAAFERRIRAFRAGAGTDALFLCGKVMNLTYYTPRLSLVRDHPLLRRDESKAESAYALQDLGEVRFVLDGDRHHLPVALASMIGKYVRELFMARLNRGLGERRPGHAPVSGYGDPTTRAFLDRGLPALLGAGIPESCLLRRR